MEALVDCFRAVTASQMEAIILLELNKPHHS